MKTYIKNNLEAIKEYLTDLTDLDLVNTWNEYAREHDSDNEIYNNDEEFFEVFFSGRTMDAIRAVSYGDYRYQDEYIKFNGYANLETFNNAEDHIDITELAEAIMDNPQDFYDIELEEEEEEEEKESP